MFESFRLNDGSSAVAAIEVILSPRPVCGGLLALKILRLVTYINDYEGWFHRLCIISAVMLQ